MQRAFSLMERALRDMAKQWLRRRQRYVAPVQFIFACNYSESRHTLDHKIPLS